MPNFFNLPYGAYKLIFSFLNTTDLTTISPCLNDTLRGLAYGSIEEQKRGRIFPENFDCISAEDQSCVLDAIYSFTAPYSRCAFRLTKISESLSPWATVLKLEINHQCFLIRLLHARKYPLPDRDLAQKEIMREILINRIVGRGDYAPVVHYANYDTGVIVTDYIEHMPDWKSDIDDSKLQLLAEVLKKITQEPLLHLIAAQKRTKFAYVLERSEDIGTTINPDFYQQIRKHYTTLKEHLEIATVKPTLIHHDLTPWNVLFTGSKFFAVDWEYSQPGNVLYDLATMAFFLKLSSAQEQSLLKFFFGDDFTITTSILREYYRHKELTCLTCCIFCFGMCLKGTKPLTAMDIENIRAYSQIYGTADAGNREDSSGRLRNSVAFFKEAELARKTCETLAVFGSPRKSS